MADECLHVAGIRAVLPSAFGCEFHATRHPIIEGYDPPEDWGWCYIDEVSFDLSGRTTPQRGPIPRYV